MQFKCLTVFLALGLLTTWLTGCGGVPLTATSRSTSTLVAVPSRTPTGTLRTEVPSPVSTLGIEVRTSGCPAATPTVWNTPNAPLRTATGKVKRVEFLADSGAHFVIVPDSKEMPAEWTISDWSHVTVLFYWAGLQTPTPVVVDQRAVIADTALNHRVTIGYYDMNPPAIVLFSIHKQEGD